MGIVLYTKATENGKDVFEYTYGARCDCKNGLEFIYDGTKIKDTAHRTKYYIPCVQELGI